MQDMYALLDLLTMLVIDPRTGVLMALLIVAAITDVRRHRIPNWLTFGGAAFGVLYAAAVPFAPGQGVMWSLYGLLLGLVIALPLYVLRAMGAGDVKLIAMSGAFLGLSHIVPAVLCVFIVGGVAAIGFAVMHRVAGRMIANIAQAMHTMLVAAVVGTRPVADTTASVGKLPYGVSIAVGTIGYIVAKQLGYL
jgi:prepilin peptidase CpaA